MKYWWNHPACHCIRCIMHGELRLFLNIAKIAPKAHKAIREWKNARDDRTRKAMIDAFRTAVLEHEQLRQFAILASADLLTPQAHCREPASFSVNTCLRWHIRGPESLLPTTPRLHITELFRVYRGEEDRHYTDNWLHKVTGKLFMSSEQGWRTIGHYTDHGAFGYVVWEPKEGGRTQIFASCNNGLERNSYDLLNALDALLIAILSGDCQPTQSWGASHRTLQESVLTHS